MLVFSGGRFGRWLFVAVEDFTLRETFAERHAAYTVG